MVCVMSLLASCAPSPQDTLRKECKASNSELPMDLGNSLIAQSVAYTDGDVVYYMTCNEDFCPLYDEAYLDDVTETMQSAWLDSTDPQMQKLMDLCRKAGADIVYECHTTQGNTYRIVIPL